MLVGESIVVGDATVTRVVAREFAVERGDSFDVVLLLSDGQFDGDGWSIEFVRLALASSKATARPARRMAATR